jgi:predicted GIY-YIG superfamily endonuclease
LKKRNRSWKIQLIEHSNPNWVDLYPSIASP